MEWSIVLEYAWVLVLLIGIEGLLAADNALVLAVMVKKLPEELRKKALFYGLAGAFVLRVGSLFVISFLVGVWQVQAIGALYLLFIAFNHIFRKLVVSKQKSKVEDAETQKKAVFPEAFAKSSAWKITFYSVLLLIAACGWIFSKEKDQEVPTMTA